ncbi:MAG: hypothetical protein IJF18_08555 [Oscillospiraceae bacterium]|nr:hypothetical protein [Oscillospiraceae bacterium]
MLGKIRENAVVFLFGGILYSMIEICFRGHTHWSMTLTGGMCLVIMYRHFEAYPFESMLAKCLFGAMVITALEFAVGCVVNLMLGWNVWDYSSRPFNIMGQVCLLFSAMWFLLSVPAVYLCRMFKNKFGGA